MSTDVKMLEDARKALVTARSILAEEHDRQIFDAAIVIIDDELAVLESEE